MQVRVGVRGNKRADGFAKKHEARAVPWTHVAALHGIHVVTLITGAFVMFMRAHGSVHGGVHMSMVR
jgi:hypothetical protein